MRMYKEANVRHEIIGGSAPKKGDWRPQPPNFLNRRKNSQIRVCLRGRFVVDPPYILSRVIVEVIVTKWRELCRLRDFRARAKLVLLRLEDVDLRCTTPFGDVRAWMVLTRAGTCAVTEISTMLTRKG